MNKLFAPNFYENKFHIYFLVCLALSTAIVFCFAYYYQYYIFSQNFSANIGDEYLSLDRSNGFIVLNDIFTVYTGNIPSFHKPPLQYWINAIQIYLGVDPISSTRFTSFVFSILLLLNSILLMRMLLPNKPVALVFVPLILATSENYWRYSVSAMLDIGAAFFSTLAITVLILSLRRPALWYLWAIVVALGALQKAPVGLLFSGVILFILFLQQKNNADQGRSFFNNRNFRYSCVLLAISLSIWPLIQIFSYGFGSVKTLVFDQMLDRFSPNIMEIDDRQFRWLDWILGSNSVVWISGIVASVLTLFKKERDLTFGIAICVLVFFLAMSLANGRVFSRYLLVVYPLISILLIVFIFRIFDNSFVSASVLLTLLIINGNFLHKEESIMQIVDSSSKFDRLYADIRNSLSEDNSLLLCPGGGNPRAHTGAISFYALNSKARLVKIRRFRDLHARLKKYNVSEDFRGICHVMHKEKIKLLFTDVEIISSQSGYIYWRAAALKEVK